MDTNNAAKASVTVDDRSLPLPPSLPLSLSLTPPSEPAVCLPLFVRLCEKDKGGMPCVSFFLFFLFLFFYCEKDKGGMPCVSFAISSGLVCHMTRSLLPNN